MTGPVATSNTFNPADNQPATSPIELIRAVNTPAGLLASRDVERLRRHILESGTEVEQNRRQQALFDQSFCTLATWPAPRISFDLFSTAQASQPVVKLGLFAWPVLVCHAHSAAAKHTFSFGRAGEGSLTAALAAAWSQALDVDKSDIRIEGAVCVERLAGLSPLQMQASLCNESRRLAHECDNTRGKRTGDAAAHDATPWSLALPPAPREMIQFEPDQPRVFLLTAFVAWDTFRHQPTDQKDMGAATKRMTELLTALLTHGLKSAQAVHRSAPASRTPLTPIIRMGRPQPLHDAITQGQGLQLAWMAERARRTGRMFTLALQQQSSFLTWSARILDGDAQEAAELAYTYDAFWRPVGHAQTIQCFVDQTQGSGQMPGSDWFGPPVH